MPTATVEPREPATRPTSITFVASADDDGGYVAVARGHDGRSLVTQGDDVEELRRMIRDCVDAAYDPDEDGRPSLVHLHMVRDEVFTL